LTVDQSKYNRNYSVNSLGFNDTIFTQSIKPLGIAKIHFDFRNLPKLMLYNNYFAIQIFDEDNNEYTLPYYFDTANNYVTAKNTNLTIRIFNSQPID